MDTGFRHTVDATYGNSGSSILRNGYILGIATHCPCPNYATRMDHPEFSAAREELAPCPGDASGNGGESLPAVETLPIYTDVFSLIMWLALGAAAILFVLSFVVKHWLHGVE